MPEQLQNHAAGRPRQSGRLAARMSNSALADKRLEFALPADRTNLAFQAISLNVTPDKALRADASTRHPKAAGGLVVPC